MNSYFTPEKLEQFKRLLHSLPAAIPYAGHAYSHNEQSAEAAELAELVKYGMSLGVEHKKEMLAALGDLSQRFQEYSSQLASTASKSSKPTLLTVIIPCGGKGASLFPMTQVMPKCLVLVEQKPIIQHIIDMYFARKDIFAKVIVATDEYHDAINHCINACGYGDFVEVVNTKSNSVPECLITLNTKIETRQFVLHFSDILIADPSWDHLLSIHEINRDHHNQIGTLLCSRYYPLAIGVITESSAAGLLDSFEEKPQNLTNEKLANIAVAVLEKEIIAKYCAKSDQNFFKETIGKAISGKEKICLHKVEKWFHVQDWNSLYRLQKDKLHSTLLSA